ncbi:MAG: hypothetical protein ACK5PF_03500 [bacterium]
MAWLVSSATQMQNMQDSMSLELQGEELRRRVWLFRNAYHPDHSEMLTEQERKDAEQEELNDYLRKVVGLFLKQCGNAFKGAFSRL